jgi:hypothetical protein
MSQSELTYHLKTPLGSLCCYPYYGKNIESDIGSTAEKGLGVLVVGDAEEDKTTGLML